jgi:hypothetical protein
MNWLLFLHIVAGALWIGGVMWQEAHTAGARRDGEEAYTRAFLKAQATNGRVYPVATILVIGTALWMIFGQDGLNFGILWIDIATALFAISFITGIAYFSRGSDKLSERLESEGYSAEIASGVRTMHMVARVEVIVLLALVWLMVFQPA